MTPAVLRLRNLSTHRPLLRDIAVNAKTAVARLPLTVAHLPDIRGHFPGKPVVPAVLILDAMFRLAKELPGDRDRVDEEFDFVRNAKFRRVVTPADVSLSLEVSTLDHATFKALAFVTTRSHARLLAAEAEFGLYDEIR